MNDEQLENVSGGNKCADMLTDDSYFLNALGCGVSRIKNNVAYRVDEIRNAWAKVGVAIDVRVSSVRYQKDYSKMVIDSVGYSVGGCAVSQNEARIYAMRQTGKFLKRNEWA